MVTVVIGERDGGSAEEITSALEAAQAAQAAAEAAQTAAETAETNAETAETNAEAAQAAASTSATNAATSATGAASSASSASTSASAAATSAGTAAGSAAAAAASALAADASADDAAQSITDGIAAIQAEVVTGQTTIQGEVAAGSTTIQNAVDAAAAEINENAEAVLAISTAIEDYSNVFTIGVGVPATGSNPNASTFVYNEAFEEDGEIIEFGYWGVNSNGTDVVKLKICSLSGSDFTRVSETTHDVTSGALTVNTVGNGLDAPVSVLAGQYWATYSHSSTARIPYIANGAPQISYWETSGDQTTTWAKGTFVSNRTMQVYVKVRYASGRIQIMLDRLAAEAGYQLIYGKHSGETLSTGTGTLSTGNTTIQFDTRPLPKAGPIDKWEVGLSATGTQPFIAFLAEVSEDGNAIDVYSAARLYGVDGANTYQTSDGTLPRLYARSARRCFPGYLCQTNGAKVRTTNGSNTVPSAGYALTASITGDVLGAHTFSVTTSNVRFDHRITMTAIRPARRNKVIYDRTFGGSVRPWDVSGAAGDLDFGATGIKLTSPNFGLDDGCKGVVEEALNKSRVVQKVTLGAYDACVIGKRSTLGNYGTAVILDVATNTLSVASVSGNNIGTVFATKTAPFGSALASGDVVFMEGIRDDRKCHLTLFKASGEQAQFTSTGNITTNGSAGAKSNAGIISDTAAEGSTLTMDLTAWFDETDLARMGFWQGTWFFACNRATPTAWGTTTAYVVGNTVTQSGSTYYCREAHTSGTFATDLAANKWGLWASSELNSVLHDSEDLDAEGIMVTDSMGDSRAPWDESWFGIMRSKVENTGRKFVLNSIHGANTSAHRITTNRLIDYMDGLEFLYFGAGMNDTTASNPVATSGGQADFIIYQQYDRGIPSVIADVFLTFEPGGDTENNDGNKELTDHLRSVASTLDMESVTFRTTASDGGLGEDREEDWFNGVSDAHLDPDTGHKRAAKQSAWQGGRTMGINSTGIVATIYTP